MANFYISTENPYLNKMKVLIYGDFFYPSMGGGELYACSLANRLSDKKIHTIVVTPFPNPEKDSFKFNVIRMKNPLYVKRFNMNFIELIRLVKRAKPDLVHFSGPSIMENLCSIFFKLFHIPTVLTYHAGFYEKKWKLAGRLIHRFTYDLLDKIIIQSNRDRNALISEGVKKSKLELMMLNGIDRNIFRYYLKKNEKKDDMTIKLMIVARLDTNHRYKGVDSFLKIFSELVKRDNGAKMHLNIVGNGDLYGYFKNLAVELGLIGNVSFLGDVKEEELVRTYQLSDFLVLPSITDGEGFGRVALEALSCGTNIIVSKFAGVSSLLKQHGIGTIYDPYFPEEAIEKIEDAFNQSTQLSSDKVNRFFRDEKLELETVVLETIKVYESLKFV